VRRRAGSEWAGVALAAGLAWLVAYPLALVAAGGLRDGDGWTLGWVRAFLARPNEWGALWGSVWISLASVALSALVGVPLAFLFTRLDFPGRRALAQLVALPVVLPPLVGVVAFLFLWGETGFLAHVVRWVTRSSDPPWRLQGAGAILLVHAYSMYVYFYLFTRAALQGIDASVYEAAQSLGAGPWRTLRTVVLPLLRPALASAALLVFLTSLASFSAPYVFGGGFRVMATQIVSTRLNGDDALAMVETIALAAVALVALVAVRRLERAHVTGGAKGTPPRPARPASRGVRLGTAAFAWALALLLLLPHATLLLVSLVPAGTWTTEALPPAYTLRNYATLVRDPVRARPLVTSLWMAAAATAAAVALGLAAGALVVRRRVRAAGLVDWLVALPWAVPGTVFALALATAFSVDAPWRLRAVLVGTPLILPLAYLVRNLPIAGRALMAGWRQLDPSYEEAAAVLGAGRRRTLRRVLLPLLRPSLVAAATLAFVTAFGDFVTSVLLYTYDTRPISLEILGSLRQGDVGVAAAYGVVLMAVSAAVFLLAAEREEWR
jgi:iron(III) transport system permease protein